MNIALRQSFERNRAAIALANVSETAIANFRAMSIGERRHRHEVATMEAIRQGILAKRPNADTAHHLSLAQIARNTAAALKEIGL